MVADLGGFLKKTDSPSEIKKNHDLIVSKDSEFIEQTIQMYLLEGATRPDVVDTLKVSNVHEYSSTNVRYIILDYRGVSESQQLSQVEELVSLLDTQIKVFVISDVDSILLHNNISYKGAAYVFWDENLNGLSSSIFSNGSDSRKSLNRSAKRILLIGSKGGVGLTTFSSVLCSALTNRAHLNVLFVDHDANDINADSYLGIKGLKLKRNSVDLKQLEIDSVVAKGYIFNVDQKLDYLTLDRSNINDREHSDLLSKLCSEVSGDYNLIIDSVSCSAFESLNFANSNTKYNRIYIVCEPSLGSLRGYKFIKNIIQDHKHSVIINSNRPAKDYLMSVSGAKERIRSEFCYVIGYESSLDKFVFKNGIAEMRGRKYFSTIVEIVKELTGKNIKSKLKINLFKK